MGVVKKMIDFTMAFVCFAFGLGGGFLIGKNYQKKKQEEIEQNIIKPEETNPPQ